MSLLDTNSGLAPETKEPASSTALPSRGVGTRLVRPDAAKHEVTTWTFASFRFQTSPFSLSRYGEPIKLRPQAAKLLKLLVENQGTTVTRKTIREALWEPDVFVDFEHSINFVIRDLRKALGDVASNPMFVETVPQTGYRFVAPVATPPTEVPRPRRSRYLGLSTWFVAASAVWILVLWSQRETDQEPNGESRVLSLDWLANGGKTWKRGIHLSESEKPEQRTRGLALLRDAVDRGEAPKNWQELIAVKELDNGSPGRAAILATDVLAEEPTSNEAAYILGAVALIRDHDWVAAGKLLKRAQQGGALQLRASTLYAEYLSGRGHHDEALAHATALLEKDPLSTATRSLLARLNYHAGNYDQAIAISSELLELRDQNAEPHWILILSNYLLGREEEARSRADAYLQAWNWPPGTASSLPAFWEVNFQHGSNPGPSHLAFLLSVRGDTGEAIDQLASAACDKDSWLPELVFVGVDPKLAQLRREEDFSRVRECLNLSASLR